MTQSKTKNIGFDVKAPKNTCKDSKCPFHGDLSLRGKVVVGTVVKADLFRTAVIVWERVRFVQKYERYEKRKTRVKVHNPECINAQVGDKVKAIETRPISKTKNMVIVENLGKDIIFEQKQDIIKEDQKNINFDNKKKQDSKESEQSESKEE